MNKFKLQNLKKTLVIGAVAAVASVGQAHAALDTGVTEALGGMNADVTTVGGFVLGAAALVLTFRMVKRAMGL
ncbi:MAG: hypothetical protein GYB41_00695 [Oceanospirillales bacterium]|nr:hypothetical protein [Oceanospirillales bacterium]